MTYSKQVSRIIQKNCQECHRAGEAAPFKLMNYADATAWSEPIREAVRQAPDATLAEYRKKFRLPLSRSALARALIVLGLSRKKSRSRPASRRSRS